MSELYKARVLGCELLTDNKEIADRLSKLLGWNNTLEVQNFESEFPGFIEAVTNARHQLEEGSLSCVAFCFIGGHVQARTTGEFGYQASNWWLPVNPKEVVGELPRSREIYRRETLIEAIAAACHQQNRVWCIAHHDESQSMWLNEPNWQRDSVIAGVKGVLAGNTPEQSHESWLKLKREEGWSYGPEKSAAAKTHPCMLPYSDLPEEQKRKDEFFVAMVQQLGKVLGLIS